jgi:hypothetical protein
MDNTQLPATLNEAILTEPVWLQAWVLILVVSQLGALAFVLGRSAGHWVLRKECLAIIPGFVVAAIIMDGMYGQFGYVRLLGLAHLIGWTGPWLWVLSRRSLIDTATLYGKYLMFYLVVAGISLMIDAIDVMRYMAGDGELYLRWQS